MLILALLETNGWFLKVHPLEHMPLLPYLPLLKLWSAVFLIKNISCDHSKQHS